MPPDAPTVPLTDVGAVPDPLPVLPPVPAPVPVPPVPAPLPVSPPVPVPDGHGVPPPVQPVGAAWHLLDVVSQYQPP